MRSQQRQLDLPQLQPFAVGSSIMTQAKESDVAKLGNNQKSLNLEKF